MTAAVAVLAQTGSEIVGLTARAHVLLAVVAAGAIVFVLRMVRRRQLAGKYALLWLAAVVPLGVLAAFPGLLAWVSERLGVFYPPALFLLVAVAFLFLIVVQFSYELSRLNERTRTLAEEVALLRQERAAGPPPTPTATLDAPASASDAPAGTAAPAGGDARGAPHR